MQQSNVSYVPASYVWNSTQKGIAFLFIVSIDIASIACNSLIILTVLLKRCVRKRPDAILVANLAFSDLLVACLVMPYTLDVLLYDWSRFGDELAPYVGFGNFLFCIASIVNLIVLAVDQWLCIKWPFKSQSFRPGSFPKCAVVFIWVYSACCAMPPAIGISSYSCFIPNTGSCSDEQWAADTGAVVFTILVTVLSWGIGVLLLIVTYSQIYLVVLKHRKNIKRSTVHAMDCPVNNAHTIKLVKPLSCTQDKGAMKAQLDSEGQQKTEMLSNITQDSPDCDKETRAKTWQTKPIRCKVHKGKISCTCVLDTRPAMSLLIIVICYFISWTPFCILLLIEVVRKKKQYNQLSLIFLWLGHSSSVSNPIIYFFRFNTFRNAARSLFRKPFANVVGVA